MCDLKGFYSDCNTCLWLGKQDLFMSLKRLLLFIMVK